MSDEQARIVAHLTRQQIALTATEIAQAMGRDRDAVLDDLRALEDACAVLGAESGYYRVANIRPQQRVRRGLA